MCLGAIGTQTAGSIIRPASFCGVAALKPSFRAISETGIVPFAPSLDHPGPFARTTRDLALIAPALLDVSSWTPQEDSTEIDPPRTRLVRPRGFYDRRADPVMLEAFERALAALGAAGAQVVDVLDDSFDFEGMLSNHRVLMAAEAAAGHLPIFEEYKSHYAPNIRGMVEEGSEVTAIRYIQAMRDWEETPPSFLSALADDPIVLLTPAAVGAAPGLETTGNPCMNIPWSYRGTPVVTFPMGLDPEGMPLGIQVVGMYGDDMRTLRVAAWCESVLRSASPPEGTDR
jgi:aspartyl-tRNA(Asn)/glutamyl-tRNA(Gln) amidotransferase subunit A